MMIWRTNKSVLVILGIFFAIVFSSNAEAAVYTSPEGIKIISDVPAWDSKEKLESVYKELLQNGHGEELSLLSEIRLHAGYPRGNAVAGEYHYQASADFLGRMKMQPGKIDLYGADERTTVESIARTLAHEYGHHVTHYYSLKQDGFSLTDMTRWRQSTYAKIRGLTNHPKVNQTEEHRWEIGEIAAEDYVQLFGSPTAKKIHQFPSRYDSLVTQRQISAIRWDASMFNIVPQENHDLPVAISVPGLYDWFAKHLNVKTAPDIPDTPDLRIKEVRKEGTIGYQIVLDWSGNNQTSDKIWYTLVAYGDNDLLPEPVVTRRTGEPMQARYGAFVINTPTSILTYKDPNAKGIRNFRVYAQNEAGFVVASPTLSLNLDNPTMVTVTTLETPRSESQKVSSWEVPVITPDLSELSEWEVWLLRGVAWIVEITSKVVETVAKFLPIDV